MISQDKLATFAEYLKPRSLADGDVVFEEGSKGESLFFVSKGQVRISKKIGKDQSKDLAVLSAGDCFGEMALINPAPRSARATAKGAATVLELGRADLDRWLKANPHLAMGFFTELVQMQSDRLRRTSSELTLLFDLSSVLLERHANPKELLARVIERVLPHLNGSWSAASYLYNMFNEEMEPAAKQGDFDFSAFAAKQDGKATEPRWLDGFFYAPLPGAPRPQGYLVFKPAAELSDEDRAEHARTLAAAARLTASGVENIGFRNEETLRNRLRSSTYGPNV